jgi:hypothetical protein
MSSGECLPANQDPIKKYRAIKEKPAETAPGGLLIHRAG